ncbi:hypothetical protein BH20ACT13_BH20ACT13_20290 [soil metagenome]
MKWTLDPAVLHALIDRTKALLGNDNYQRLRGKYERGAREPHRLIVLIERTSAFLERLEREGSFEVEEAEFAMLNVTLSELRTVVELLEEANTIPAFKRVEATINETKDYNHTLLLLAAREFLEAVGNGSVEYYSTTTSAMPDLRVSGSGAPLYVEVYAPLALQHPEGGSISNETADAIIDRKRKDKRKRRQLEAGDALLLIGGAGSTTSPSPSSKMLRKCPFTSTVGLPSSGSRSTSFQPPS